MVPCELVSNGSRKSCSIFGFGFAFPFPFATVDPAPDGAVEIFRRIGFESCSSSDEFRCRFLGETREKKEWRFGLFVVGATVVRRAGLLECRFGSESRGSAVFCFGRNCRLGEEAADSSSLSAGASSGRGEVGGEVLDPVEVSRRVAV